MTSLVIKKNDLKKIKKELLEKITVVKRDKKTYVIYGDIDIIAEIFFLIA